MPINIDLALTAADLTNVPAGTIAATDVQAAINELDTEKASASSSTAFTNKTFTDQVRLDQPNDQATDRGFDLTTRNVAGIAYPVPTLIPTTNNRTIALDIMPKGAPTHDALNGYAWMDICSADILTTNSAVNTLRMGVLSTFVEVSSKLYNGASSLPMKFRMQTGAATFVDSIVIDSTGKKIGFQTASPNYALQIHETATLTSTSIQITNGSSGSANTDGLNIGIDSAATPNAYILHRENSSLRFYTNATLHWSISNAGVWTAEDAKNIAFGTGTGTKIGTATSQKIGFWNATPVVQPSGWGAPTGTLARTSYDADAATLSQVAQRLAALITDLTTIGIIGA